MGQAKDKKRRFLAAHPYCCFCGGNEPATTVDHVPPRTCFAGRAAPEGFEFPACDKCQAATRLDELAVGAFVRFCDQSKDNYSSDELRGAIKGIRNNLPHLLPSVDVTTNEKRRALRDKGLTAPPGWSISEIPMVKIPPAMGQHVHRYARKLAAALYYREKGRPVGLDFGIETYWTVATDQRQMEAFVEVAKMSPFVTVGKRPNINFGDRFGYRYDKSDDNHLFTAVAQFEQGLVVGMLVVDGESANEIDEADWVPVAAMFDQ